MLFFIPSLLLAGIAWAQTPPGFSPNVTNHLDVIYPSATITPGLQMQKAAVASMPIIGTQTELNGTYLFLMIDIDLYTSLSLPLPNPQSNPQSNSPSPPSTTGGPRGTVLHGLITNFKPSSTLKGNVHVLTSKDTGPSSYFGPSPPAETPAHPHHYIELLFEQPANFAVPSSMKSQVSSRVGFNVTQLISLTGLREPVAANWFMVTG